MPSNGSESSLTFRCAASDQALLTGPGIFPPSRQVPRYLSQYFVRPAILKGSVELSDRRLCSEPDLVCMLTQ